jgi:tight adherence protein B
MADISTTYALFFVFGTLLTLGAYNYFSRDYQSQKAINRRLALFEDIQDRRKLLDHLRRERGISLDNKSSTLQKLQEWITQTGLRLNNTKLFLIISAGSAIVMTLTIVAMHYNPLAPLVGIVASGLATYYTLGTIRKRRISRFEQQLPDAIDVMVRSLRAGHPVPISLSLVAKEMRDPAGTEFGIAFDEITYGLDNASAIGNLSRRVGAEDLLFLVASITIQSQSGGNLGEILARLSRTIRERFKLRAKVRAMTTDGRMSALVLTMLPVALFAFIYFLNNAYYARVWDDPMFQIAMPVGIALLGVGNFIMQRMVNFKF